MISFYFDENVPRAVARQLRRRQVDVLTAQEDGRARTDDSILVRRATGLGRVFFSQDEDVWSISAKFQRQGTQFSGIVYAEQSAVTIGGMVKDLEILAKAGNPGDLENQIWPLPL